MENSNVMHGVNTIVMDFGKNTFTVGNVTGIIQLLDNEQVQMIGTGTVMGVEGSQIPIVFSQQAGAQGKKNISFLISICFLKLN
jgi:hypothetical protein